MSVEHQNYYLESAPHMDDVEKTCVIESSPEILEMFCDEPIKVLDAAAEAR